ncbi:zinc ribbon domain-containing protein [Methanobrevibacter sp.]|uniref:zinc ribbon domain-containing protein n=1 Tax=Methanobrevibacter sp. TaxID=66852 RepID=UPI00388DD381
MKCEKCGFENKKSAKFCASCGTPMESAPAGGDSGTSNSKYIIIALVIVIIMLVAVMGYFAGSMNSNNVQTASDVVENSSSKNVESSADEGSGQTHAVSSSQSKTTTVEESKSWVSIGSYSGSGSGSQSISVPSGKIMVKLSAYPIKNYATNHLYVTGPNGESGGVDWGSHSDVETRSDSFTCTLSSSETFTIDYYETVSWEVEFFRYQ